MLKKLLRYGIVFISFTLFSLNATQISLRNLETEPRVEDYNVKLGNLTLDLSYNLGVIYNDNTNRAHNRGSNGGLTPPREEGTKIGNSITMKADWPINSNFNIQTGVRVAYEFFAGGEGTDGFSLSGVDGNVGADIAFDFRLGQGGLITLKEEISRDIDSVEVSRVDNADDFSLWNNNVFLQYQNQLSSNLSAAAQVGRQDTWSDKSEFDYRNFVQYTVAGTLSWQINSSLEGRPYISYATTDYNNRDSQNNRHNDTYTIETGFNLQYNLTERTTVRLGAGYLDQEVDQAENPLKSQNNDTNEEDGYVGRITFINQLTDILEHRLSLSFDRSLGTSTLVNFSDDVTTSYSLRWEFTEDWELRGQVSLLKSNESTPDGENADIYTSLAGLRHTISTKSNVSFDYRRTDKFSNQPGSEYERNEFRLLFGYDF